jgi:hypothetical protein
MYIDCFIFDLRCIYDMFIYFDDMYIDIYMDHVYYVFSYHVDVIVV